MYHLNKQFTKMKFEVFPTWTEKEMSQCDHLKPAAMALRQIVCPTFEPEVIFESLCQQCCSLITKHWVVVDGNSSDSRHPVQIRPSVT